MTFPAFLTRNVRLKALATTLAMLSWVGVVFAANPPETRTVSVPIPQDSAHIPAKYVLVGPIANVVIRLAGTREHLNGFDISSLQVTADFHSVSHTGEQSIPLTVVNRDRNVELDSAPTTVTADLDELSSSVVPVTIVVANPPPLGYVTSGQAVEPDRVTVAGPKHELAGLQARVRVDLSNQKANLQQDFPLLLADSKGTRLNDLGVSPPTVRVTITIAATATSRATAVLPKTVATVVPGHQLTGITVEPATVLLSGPQDLLNSLDSVGTAPVSLAGLTADTVVTAKVAAPAGIRSNPDTVTIRISVATVPVAPAVTPTPVASSPTATPSPSPSPPPSPSPT